MRNRPGEASPSPLIYWTGATTFVRIELFRNDSVTISLEAFSRREMFRLFMIKIMQISITNFGHGAWSKSHVWLQLKEK